MKKELLSITDENSILITAEFLESGRRLAFGGTETQRIEIDLIVNKNITCEQLLEAIKKGLENNLWDMGLPPDSDKFNQEIDSIYMSYRDTNLSSAHISFPMQMRERLRRNKKIIKDEKISREIDSYSEKGQEDRTTDNKYDYLICWKVFNECYNAYLQDYNNLIEDTEYLERVDNESLTPDYVYSHPVIGRGSFDVNKVGRDELMSVGDRPQCWLFYGRDKDRTLADLGFITTTRVIFDPILWHHSTPLFEERETNAKITPAFQNKTPEYNISDRPLKRLSDEEISIIEPTSPPQSPKQNILSFVLPTILSVAVLFAVRMLMANSVSSLSMGLMSIAMGITTLVTGLVNRKIQKKDFKIATAEWKKQYEDYITRIIKLIVNRQQEDVRSLHMLYPPTLSSDKEYGKTNSIVHKILTVNGDIYSRGPNHPDFLSVRIGTSAKDSHLVQSVFDIVGTKKDAVFTSIRYKNILCKEKMPFRILMEDGKDTIDSSDGSSGYLINLPVDISEKYRYLDNAPVMLNLKDCGSLGLVYGAKQVLCKPFIDNVLLDLCFNHSPEDLQFVLFFENTEDLNKQHSIIRNYKHLPHFHELLGDLSAFVFNEGDAHRVFNKLTEILGERKDAGTDAKFPHIVVIFQCEYNLKKHPFSQVLPEFSEAGAIKTEGISFVFCTEYVEQLPKYCGRVIHFQGKDGYYLLPHTIELRSNDNNGTDSKMSFMDEKFNFSIDQYRFIPDKMLSLYSLFEDKEVNDEYYRAYKTLSALYYERIAQGADMPNNVSLFELIRDTLYEGISESEEKNLSEIEGLFKPLAVEQNDAENEEQQSLNIDDSLKKIESELIDYIRKQLGYDSQKKVFKPKRSVNKSLSAPIGENAQGIVELDLHEKGDGPHMLVAGTTGSGKTETILTYLVNLCSLYSPEQVTLLLMDMKGEDFVRRIGDLPHVVGKVTDVDGEKVGNSTVYMLKRFLLSMNAEVKRRKVMLSKMGVNNISSYIEAKANLKEHMRNNHIDESKEEELKNLEAMPHLFLVIDEFTELMQFTSENSGVDFKSAITSLARVGRSLGFHIILISQNIENAITPDIRVNSRARLCLRVATRDASKEMIGTDLAASPLMPGNGRAYLHVGNGSRFEYFQSAYSGTDVLGFLDEPIILTFAKPTGEYVKFYDSKKQIELDKNHKSEDSEKVADENLKSSNLEQSGITQIQLLCECIKDFWQKVWENEASAIQKPHLVFEQPLPTHCWYDCNQKRFVDISDVMKKEGE